MEYTSRAALVSVGVGSFHHEHQHTSRAALPILAIAEMHRYLLLDHTSPLTRIIFEADQWSYIVIRHDTLELLMIGLLDCATETTDCQVHPHIPATYICVPCAIMRASARSLAPWHTPLRLRSFGVITNQEQSRINTRGGI